VYLKINGRMVYLWRAVDAEGEVLDVLIQSRRNMLAALKLMRKLLKKYGLVPNMLVTDDLRFYAAVAGHLGMQDDTSAVDGATTGPKIRINRPGDGNVRCKVSRALGRRKGFSQRLRPFTTPSMPSAISLQQGRTEPFALRRWNVARCRRGRLNYIR
jgi:transposase-like protein